MSRPPSKTSSWAGSASAPVAWPSLVEIFDALYSAENRGLPRFPASLTTVVAAWSDSSECRYEAANLDDLRSPYDAQTTASITFYGREPGGRKATFEYWPGPPMPRASATVTGPPDKVESILSALRYAFPNPFDGLRLFLSWGGDESKRVAAALSAVLEAHFPALDVFFSPTSIDPGDDPGRRLLHEGLLQSQVLVAVLTEEAANRPWVIWETAAAWARQQLLIPIFVHVDPAALPGPLTSNVQGVHLSDRERLDRAMEIIATRLELPAPGQLSGAEFASLQVAR